MLVNWFIIEIGEESAIIPQQPVSIDDESNQQFTNDVRYSADNSIDANCSNNGDNNVVMQDVVSAVGLFKTAQFLLCVCVFLCVFVCACVPVYPCPCSCPCVYRVFIHQSKCVVVLLRFCSLFNSVFFDHFKFSFHANFNFHYNFVINVKYFVFCVNLNCFPL